MSSTVNSAPVLIGLERLPVELVGDMNLDAISLTIVRVGASFCVTTGARVDWMVATRSRTRPVLWMFLISLTVDDIYMYGLINVPRYYRWEICHRGIRWLCVSPSHSLSFRG